MDREAWWAILHDLATKQQQKIIKEILLHVLDNTFCNLYYDQESWQSFHLNLFRLLGFKKSLDNESEKY